MTQQSVYSGEALPEPRLIDYEMTYETFRQWVTIQQALIQAVLNGDAIQRDKLIHELHQLPGYPSGSHPTNDKIRPIVKRKLIARVSPTRRR